MLLLSGSDAAPGEWPWMAVLLQEGQLRQFCAGTLVSASHVLTAAHCQPGFLASLLVELGEYDISGPNEFMSTKEHKVDIS